MTCATEVAVPALTRGDVIHVQPHQVFRHTPFAHTVTCREQDVQVDRLLPVEGVIVVCWGHCGGTCGAVVYDADDRVLRITHHNPGSAA